MSEGYETFDSGSGPVIPEKEKGNFEHMDKEGAKGIADKVTQGEVPETPSK